MTKNKNDRELDEKGDAAASAGPEGAATRRGFLFSLLGGLAGIAGFASISARSKTASIGRSGAEPAPGRKLSGPIDNIFVTLPPRKSLKRRGL